MRRMVVASLLSLVSGCASSSWSVMSAPHAVSAIAVAPIATDGDASVALAAWRRAAFIERLRARGYNVCDPRPGVPLVQVRLGHYGDGAHETYYVAMTLSEDERVVASGAARASDPGPAMRALAARLFDAAPPRGERAPALASR